MTFEAGKLNTVLIAAGILLLAACRTLPEYVSVSRPGYGQYTTVEGY